MPLIQKITEDMKTAMKSGDKARLEVLRFIIAGLNAAKKEKTLKDPEATLSDTEVISLLQKEAKKRKEATELFREGNRNDLVEKEESDLQIIYEYLPRELSKDEVVAIVKDLKEKGFNDFSSLMRESMKAVQGRADGKMVG